MKALFRMISGHAEAQRDGGAEMEQLNHQTTKPSNHQTIFCHKGHKERKEGEMEVGMNAQTVKRSNRQTTKLSNHQTMLGRLGRWAAGAAVVAAGVLLGGAREAKAWIGNSFIYFGVNGATHTWYNGSGTGNATPGDLGSSVCSLSIGGQVQTYGQSDGAGNPATLKYAIDGGSVHDVTLNWWKYQSNNNWFQRGGGTETSDAIDLSPYADGEEHTIAVWFYSANLDEYDSNNGDNYVFTFTSPTPPTMEVTGVDSSEFTVNWNDGDKPYSIRTSGDASTWTSGMTPFEFTDDFTSAEGWAAQSSTFTGTKDAYSGRWLVKGMRGSATDTLDGNTGFIALYDSSSYITSPPFMNMIVTQVVIKASPYSTGTRSFRLDVTTNNWAKYTSLATYDNGDSTDMKTFTFGTTGIFNRVYGTQFRLYRSGSGSQKIWQFTVRGVLDNGESWTKTGASGTQYAESTRGAEGTAWGNRKTVALGTKPGEMSAGSITSSGMTFSWGSAGASATGYIVDATTAEGASGSSSCPNSTLTRYGFGSIPASSSSWFYYGDEVSSLTGNVGSAPAYNTTEAHQVLGRVAGLVSPDIALAGAKDVTLTFTVKPQNLGSYGSVDNATAEVWYSLKPAGGSYGVWTHLATTQPANNTTAATRTFSLPKGAYDDPTATVRFMITTPKTMYSGNYYRGAMLTGVGVTWAAQGGNYATPLSGFPKTVTETSTALTGLGSEQTVYFKVKALQGDGIRSVWVEGNGTTATAVTVPTVTTRGATVTGTETATLGGKVTATGGASITKYGIAYGTGANPTASGTHVETSGAPTLDVDWTKDVAGLSPGTTYHYRAYAYNSAGYGYGADATFTTLANQTVTVTAPTLTYGGGTGSLTVTAPGSGAKTYSSSDEGVVTVSSTGVLTPVGAGTATITVTVEADSTYAAGSGTCTVTVDKKNPTVTASVSPTSIRVGGTATLTGTTDSGATLSFGTSASAIASLSGSGAGTRTVTGVAYGTATLTVTSPANANYNEGSATCTITVLLVKPTLAPTITGTSSRAVNSVQIDFSHPTSAGYGNGTFILMRAGSSITATPTDGSGKAYKALNNSTARSWSGTSFDSTAPITYVVVNSTVSTRSFVKLNGLTGATHYYVKPYGYNSILSESTTSSQYTSDTSQAYSPAGTEYDFWTLATQPETQASGASATPGSRKATLSWTAGAMPSGGVGTLKYLVVVRTSGTQTAPDDGRTYSAGETLGPGTVAYVGEGTVSGSTVTAEITGLEPDTTGYKVTIYAFAEGGDPSTAHYRTGSPATTTFNTIPSQGPRVWATGVDATSYLLNWSPIASDTTGYDIQTGSGTPVVLLDEDFTTSGGWKTAGEATGDKTAASGKWYLSHTSTTAGSTDAGSYLSPDYNDAPNDAWIQLPPTSGTMTKLLMTGYPNSSGTRGFYVDIDSGSGWVNQADVYKSSWSSSSTVNWTPSTPIDLTGKKVRLRLRSTQNLNFQHIRVEGTVSKGVEGYSRVIDGLTAGTTYTAQVRKNPDGDWSDDLSVKAGVVPNTPTASAVRNAVTFSWTDAQSGAAGYIVDATTTAAGWANKSCPAEALTLGSFGSGQDWKYTGTTATSSDGSVKSAPAYSTAGDDGHFLIGRAGNAIESKPFAIAGATGLKLTFTVEAWNLASVIERGRVNAYYKMDSEDWCYFGTALPSGAADNDSAAVTLPVPKGALNGTTIAFRLVAVGATGHGESYLRGPYINNLKVESTSVGAGYYGANSLSGYPQTLSAGTTSHKVSGLTAGQTVRFRVQALQGSTANPTAKSVWVETTGTASAYTPPGTPSASGILRNAMTLTWTAGNTTDLDHYVLQVGTASGFGAGTYTEYEVAAGTLTKAVSGLTGNTTYYFRVKAVGTDSQESAWSSNGNATTAAYTAPSAITFSSVTRNSMTVSWTAGNTTDLSKYVLQRSTASDFSSGVTSYDVTGGTNQAITGLSASTKYYYRVKAVGTDGQESAWSPTANQTTSGFPGPATVTASGESRNGMTLTWTAVSGAASYNVQWTTCPVAAEETTVASTTASGSLAYDTHSATDWTYRKGYSASAGYAAGAYPQWNSDYGHWLAGQYVNTTYKPGVETPDLDFSDATSATVTFQHRNYKSGTNTSTAFSPITLYYSLDGGSSWTAGGTSTAGGNSWASKTLTVPAAALGRKDVRLQLRADKAAAYYDTSASAYKVMGAGIKDIYVKKIPTGGDYTCAATQSRNVASGTTTALTGLAAETLYYFRVQAVGSDSQTSSWTAGSSSTTPFAGPTGLAITDAARYTLTAGWDAYAESGYTTQYEVQLTPCANAGAEATTVGTCPALNLEFGTSATDWTYQREYSGSTASSYPKYENSVHKLWGQYSSTSVEPGILSPELDLAGYVSANVEFSHMYVNRANMSEVALYYSLDEGANWTLVQETGTAAGATAATASNRSIPLPAEALAGGVKLLLRTKHATNYDLNPPNEDWRAQGASIANLVVTARGVGGGDYECGTATAIQGPQSSASKIFSGLSAGSDYYIRVRTVLTPAGGGAAERSAWTEIPAATAVPQPPPEEVWAEGIRQNHMTVAWSEAPGATASTRYKYEVTKCGGATATEVAAAEARTDGDLEEGIDDWSYVGGGTAPDSTQQEDYGFLMETYPAWARLSENSIVLAGAGSPGIESAEFSTVGATAGTVTFLHGRWYNKDHLATAAVTLSYSIDGGDSWEESDTVVQTATDISTAYATYSRSLALPSGALGHAHVKVRLEARAAADTAGTSGSATYVGKPVGAALKKAKVTLTKQGGDYTGTGCRIAHDEDLTADQLSAELEYLLAGTTYYFRVAASDGVLVGGSPQYGAWVEGQAKTKAAPAAPASAWVVPESIGRHAMTVQWDAVAEAETYVVKVYQGTSASGTLKQTLETSATSLTVTGLEAQQDYYFTIQSKADGESSSGTANTTATTSAALNITGFCVTNILDESLSVKWDNVAATTYTLEVGPMTTDGATGALYETIECPATTLARSDKGNGWFYLGGNANYPKYYVKSSGTAAQKAEDQGHVLSYSSAGTPGIQSRWFSTFGAKSATIEFLHGRWFNGGANSALQVFYSIDGGTTWTLAGDIASTANEVPGSAAAGGAKTVTRFALPERALGQRTVAIRLLAPNAASGGSYGYGAEIKDLTIKLEAYPEAASTFSGSVSGGVKNLSGLAAGQRYWFRLTATETGAPDSATAIQTAATRTKTTGVVQSQGFEGPRGNGALDTTAWGYSIKYIPVQNSAAEARAWQSGDPVVEVVDGENPMYGDRALRMSGSASAGVYGVVEFANKNFEAAQNVAVTIPFAACDLAEGENLWVTYSVNGGSTWVAPEGLATLAKSGMTLGKIGRGGSDAPNQNWPYNRGLNETTRPAGDAYTFEVHGASQIAVRVAFCGNSGSAKHYYYLDEVKLERLATPPSPVSALANSEGSVDLGWTPAGGQSVVIIRGQDQRTPPASVDLNSLPQGYEALKDGTNFYWVNTADPGVARTNLDTGVTGGWKYFYYFYGALANGDGTYTLSKECVAREVIVKGMVEAIASQGWDGWDVHPWGYRKGRTTNPGRAGDCGYWAYNQSGDTLPYEWAHFVENSWEYDGDARGAQGANTYAYYYGAGKTYGPAGRTDPDCTNQLGVSSYTNYFGTNCFRLSGGSGWTWSGPHTWTNNSGNVRTETDPTINTNNAAIQFDTIDLSGYKNVQFSFHYAQTYSGGGNYMHVAISTNGNGENGSWMAYDNKNDGGWRQVDASRDYGLQLQTMTSEQTGGNVDFYDESRAPYGNPFVLNVPDAVTQMTVRLTFFDTTGHDQRKALVFVDEVRLTGEVAIEKPKPYISEIGKNQFMVHWEAVPDATSYDVQVTEYCDESKIKLSQAFAVKALPKDWTKSDSGVTFTKSASRLYSGASGDHDFGLNLSGASGVLTSPEVGGTTNLQFFAKALRIGTETHLIVEAKGDKDTAWEQIGDWTATQLTTGWKGYTNSLPNRQWTQVRFRRTGGDGTSDSIYVDDIEFHGEGIYTGTVAYQTSGISATNQLATGLTSGKRYLAHVRAVGSPAGVVVRSAWGETADWTAGDFAVTSDGFEMTRSTWASPGSGIAVIAVNDGKAFSEVPAPTGAPAVGSAVGEGVVIAQTTDAQSGAGFEHVVPYGARTDVRDQKYVVYWKRGSYWEGRLETNVVLDTYVCPVAEAFAYTNATAMGATGSQTYLNGGKGWSGAWNVQDKGSTWDAGTIDRTGGTAEGLLETNQLWGAGGNMITLYPGNNANNQTINVKRDLASPLSKNAEWWGMFTMKVTASGPDKWAGIQLLNSSGTDKVSIGKLWDAKDSSNNNQGKVIGFQGSKTKASDYVLNDGGQCVIVFKWDGSKMWLKTFWYENTSNPVWARTATFPGFDVSETLSIDDIHAIRLVAQNSSSAYLDNVYFDEIRIGGSWDELVGKEPVPPFPVAAATTHAVVDGKEMIRLDWVKPAGGTDTTVVPNVERPAASTVVVLEKNLNTEFTADQLAMKTGAAGDSALIGDAVVTVVYRGSGTEIEHVVLPGTSHRYAFISYASGVYAESALQVSTDTTTGNALTMDRYGETEYVNPFSYTNSFEVSGSGTGTEWRGGNGFTNAGGSTVHFWATGDGQNGTTANAGTWTPVKPSASGVPSTMTTEIPNYKPSAGNVMLVSPSANTSASLGRTLATDQGGQAGKTFYIAYRMSYQYAGENKWAGLKLIDNDSSHRGVFVGKSGTSDASKNTLLAIDPGRGVEYIGYGNYGLTAGGGFLIAAKVLWTADGTANVYAMAKYGDGTAANAFPENEPNEWNAQWIGMPLSGIHMIELLAGGSGSGVTPGNTYFDEIRYGSSWDDLLGPKVPTDVWMAGLSADVFLGDYVVNNITSKPHGPGQSAKHLLSSAAEPSGAAWAAGVDAGYVREITTETPTQSEWIATNQFKATGTLYAYGSATGDGETVYSWQHGNSTYRKNTYTVSALPAPVLTATGGQGYKVPLSWTRGTSSGRTFEEVMVVRYADLASYNLSEGNLHPEQGKAYYVGDTFSYSGNEARYATVIYRGTATGYTNRPCSNGTTYYYAAYTVNNNYYSARNQAYATPSGDGGQIEVDGDPTDWVGTPAEPWNSSIFSEGELIWTDKLGEERTDKPNCTSADITEFRVKADSTNVYFLLQLNGGTSTMPTNAHIAVGLDTRLSTTSTEMNWLADESYTFLGGAYYTNSPAFHYPKIQMGVHWVGGDRNEWQVELYDVNSASWHAPRWWKASSALNGSGVPIATATPCVEWVVPRSELGLDGVTGTAAVTGRFSVATFLNSGSWNNEAVGVVLIASNSCAAVDALAIAPYGANDKDYALGAWDEGLKNNNVDFWMDARFGASALLSDDVPSTPANPTPANDGTGAGNPTLQWSNSTDAEGFVTGWLLEVADTPNFGGDGGHTENGSVLYRVNIEMTPALAEALAADSSRKISYKPMTNCREFWWRVRARDNAGQLSAATVQHYTVTGKQDNDGPVATLKYVGSQVGKFLGDSEYRAEVERNGEAYSIMDSEFGSSSAEFGFVIEWYDINGVYATNHMRAWVDEYDGVDNCEDGHSKWPEGKFVGDYTWNILATNGDGTAYGRVSPNWDLMMVNTNRTSSQTPDPASITVRVAGGGTKTLTWEHHGGTGEPELLIPDAMGEYQPAEGWVIQWGYDDAFQGVGTENKSTLTFSGETLRAYDEGGTETSCNGVQYLTNFVNGVFGLPEYDPEVDLYLTLSAEDCCTSDQWGEQPWDPWPPSLERDHQGSYRGLSCSEYPGQAHENVLTGGWCADGPNPARNVTVNQLIKINVRDNDVLPPIASTNRWAADAADDDGTEFKPSLLVSTNTIAASPGNTTWETITGKLPRREGVQRDVMYQLTDAMMAGGTRPLSFFFNVYDDYIESGTQRGTASTTPNTGNTRSLTNSAFVVKTWDPALNEGAGAWVASAENTADFVADGSYISDMVHDGTGWHEAEGSKGTGPSTVLRWDFSTSDINSLFGMTDILSYIGTHSDGVTNVVQLHAWDSDDNRANDQADAEITFGRLLFSDDDATVPESPGYTFYGSGTNFIRFGSLAGWTFTGKQKGTSGAGITSTDPNPAQMMHGMSASRVWAGSGETPLSDTTAGTQAEGVYWTGTQTGGRLTMSRLQSRGRYFEFDLTGLSGTRWVADTLVFNNQVSATGPTTLELEWLEPTATTETDALTGSDLTSGWNATGACDIQTVAGFDRFKMASPDSSSGTLTSPAVSTAGKVYARVSYRVGALGSVENPGPALTVTVKKNGSSVVGTPQTIKLTDFEATAAAENYRNWNDYVTDLPLDPAGSADTYTVEWTATDVNGSVGFLLRDVSIRTEGNFANPHTLATVTVPKELDENKGAGSYADYTETTVTMMWSGEEVPGDETMRFRLYAYGADQAGGSWGIKDVSIHGISYAPKGHEISDSDMRYGTWTNALEVIDGEPTGYDTEQSGLWIVDDGQSYAQYPPRYTLNYPEAYGEHPAAEVVHDNYSTAGITLAAYTYAADPAFTNTSSGWSLGGEAVRADYEHAKVGSKVLKLPANGSKSSATQTRTLSTTGLGAVKTGATISGNISLRALSTTAEGVDNLVDLKVELLDASNGVIDTRVYNLEANRMVGWREIVLDPWSVLESDIAKVRVTISQHNAGGSEVYVDDVALQMALWGEESNVVSASHNGKPGAKFRLSTQPLASSTDVPLSADATAMTGSGSTEYTLVSTVFDYDHDRTADAIGVSITNRFLLYDDDEETPKLGSRFGGSLSARVGDGGNAKYADSGTAVNVHVTDRDLALAYGSDHSARMDLDIDAYDFSGWGVIGLDLVYNGTSSQVYTNGGSANFLTFAMTNDAALSDQPAATNTLGAAVSAWWNRADVKAEFAKTETGSRQPMAVLATISDWDNDRLNDSLTLVQTETAGGTPVTKGAQVGLLSFIDSDTSIPRYKGKAFNFENFFIGTNDVAAAFGTSAKPAISKASEWTGKGDEELRRTTDTDSGLPAESHVYTNGVYTVYDGELRREKPFYIMANLGDSSGGAKGQYIAGVKQGATLTDPATTDVFGNELIITNTSAVIYRGETEVTNLVSHWSSDYSGAQNSTRSVGGAVPQTWLYPSGLAWDEVGLLLPSGVASNDLAIKFDVWDADTDRPEDQLHAVLTGPALRVLDNDTQWPNPPTGLEVNGTPVTTVGEMTRLTAPWTNKLSDVDVRFTAATDQEPAGFDTKKSEVARYQIADESATITHTSTNLGKTVTTSAAGDKLKANLGAVTMDQGFGKYQLFAVDADDDRPGDGLASDPVDVPLAYDITKPTAVAPNGNATTPGNRLVADPDNTDDPTTQFDLTWPIDGIGPDDPSGDATHYNAIPKKYKDDAPAANNVLSPWYSYKIYYTNFEESAVSPTDNPSSMENSWVYQRFIADPAAANYYTNWAFVMTNSPVQDPSAPKDGTGRSTAYDSLGSVAATAGLSGKQRVRLYDLDFDQHYVVIIVGVDKAGNEGPAGMWSWATNNTIKFAITQGVIRASADINAAIGVESGTNTVGMAPITGDNAPAKAAVLRWMAAGMKNGVGNVSKYYDLIYRDAASFNELGNEVWHMAGEDGGNSGTSKTNWNYQTDAGLSTPGRLRFYRASYTGRWQDKKPGTEEYQYPLASEEVYSMNNIVLSEGWNYVSLQGVPWTNTFRGVFGTDTTMWPSDAISPVSTNGAVVVEFYNPGTTTRVKEWYFFGADGNWHDSTGANVTDKPDLPANFFARPFSITLPESNEDTDAAWWTEHSEFVVTNGSKERKGILWHPIMQVPTNGPAAGGVFSQDIDGSAKCYNTLSLNLPVAVHPRKLGLVATDVNGKPVTVASSMQMFASDQPWLADRLYVVDSAAKEVRGGSMIYCDTAGDWRFVARTNSLVPDGFIHPNDMLVLVSGTRPSGAPSPWTWTYTPSQFYSLPNRHMGRTLE